MEKIELGFDEVVDTAVDILECADQIGDAVSDGIQISDMGVLFSVAPKALEIKRDGKVAIAQLLDLNPEEAAIAAAQIAERTGKPVTGIIARVNEGFTLTVRTYRLVSDGTHLVQDWVRFGKSIRQSVAPAA